MRAHAGIEKSEMIGSDGLMIFGQTIALRPVRPHADLKGSNVGITKLRFYAESKCVHHHVGKSRAVRRIECHLLTYH